MDSLTLYEEGWLNSLIRRLARDFEVKRERVRDAGEVQEQDRYLLICGDCRLRQMNAPQYLEAYDGSVPYRVEFVVDLLPKLRSLNSITGTLWLILAGQCADCGAVYFVKTIQRRK